MAELLNQDARTSHSIVATSGLAEDRTRVLKHGDTFAVLNHYGGIQPGGLGEEGLYHEGTRFLSRLSMDLEGKGLFFLGPSSRGENGHLSIALTNPDQMDGDELRLPFGTLFLALRTFLWQRVYYQELRVKNYGLRHVETFLDIHFDADFADIFEVRGMKRRSRGVDLAPEVSRDGVTLSYRGLDEVVRRTSLQFTPGPSHLDSCRARIALSLAPQREAEVLMTVSCERDCLAPRVGSVDRARLEAQTDRERYSAWSCHIQTSDAQMDAWIDRASADVQMLTTELPTGPYPYAGLPWFNTPFGRDGIITALECLWMRPGLARGVLAYLAATQATESIADQDAEPGKILHETRRGEMATLGEMPFGRITEASMLRPCSSYWPAPTTNGPPIASS